MRRPAERSPSPEGEPWEPYEPSFSITPSNTPPGSQAPDAPVDMREAALEGMSTAALHDNLLDIHEAAMEAVEARAQPTDIHEAAMEEEKEKKGEEFELNESGANVIVLSRQGRAAKKNMRMAQQNAPL